MLLTLVPFPFSVFSGFHPSNLSSKDSNSLANAIASWMDEGWWNWTCLLKSFDGSPVTNWSITIVSLASGGILGYASEAMRFRANPYSVTLSPFFLNLDLNSTRWRFSFSAGSNLLSRAALIASRSSNSWTLSSPSTCWALPLNDIARLTPLSA